MGVKTVIFCHNHFAQKRTEAWGDSEITQPINIIHLDF